MPPDVNAYFLVKHLKNAQLILYPDSGHGALFQYSKLFVEHVALSGRLSRRQCAPQAEGTLCGLGD
jgi:hypothetical protein